jgi:hypothetical protein
VARHARKSGRVEHNAETAVATVAAPLAQKPVFLCSRLRIGLESSAFLKMQSASADPARLCKAVFEAAKERRDRCRGDLRSGATFRSGSCVTSAARVSAARNYTRDRGGPFGLVNQVLISSVAYPFRFHFAAEVGCDIGGAAAAA